MRRLLRLAARLYPPTWRSRYGAEFDALLDDANAGWRELGDVLAGAIAMQLTARSFAKTTAICGALGIVIASAVAFRQHDMYVSTAVIRVELVAGPETIGDRLHRIELSVLSRASLADVIRKFDLFPEECREMPLEDVVQEMRNRHIQIIPAWNGRGSPPDSAFVIGFSYPDGAKAQAVTQDLTRRVIESGLLRQSSFPLLTGDHELTGNLLGSGVSSVRLSVLDPASLPVHPSFPNRPAIILAGLAIGLAAGLLIGGIRRWPAVALCGIAGMLVAGAASFVIRPTWMATAVVQVKPPEAAEQVAAQFHQAAPGVDVRVIQPTRPQPGPSGILQIRASDRNPAQAQAAVRQFEMQMIRDAGPKIGSIEVLDRAGLAPQPAGPKRLSIALLGLVVGLLAGTLWRWRRPRRALIPTA